MLKRSFRACVLFFLGTGAAFAQEPPLADPAQAPPTNAGTAIVASPPAAVIAGTEVIRWEVPRDADACWWGSLEYLLWRVKNAPVPIPLVSTNPDPATIAALNQPGTTILFGEGSNQSTGFGWFSGMRFSLGKWSNDEQLVGWEVDGFGLERRSNLFSASSAGGAARVVAIPVNTTEPFVGNPAGETSQNAFGFPNRVSVHLNTRLWGAELNGVANLYRTRCVSVTGLVGFRYVDLVENLTVNDTIADPFAQGVISITDGFGTRNQFYGGQLGLRASSTRGRWTTDAGVKVALGSTHQVMSIGGSTQVTQGAFGFLNGTTPAGVFAEPSNSGRFNRNVFAAVPEVQVNVGYLVTQGLRPFVGYNFMYLSNAVRPGEQMDRNVNLTQNPFANFGGAPTGAAAPLPIFRSGDYWAQGIQFGMEMKY